MIFDIDLNSRSKGYGSSRMLGTAKNVSRKPISVINEDCIEELKKANLKKRTES